MLRKYVQYVYKKVTYNYLEMTWFLLKYIIYIFLFCLYWKELIKCVSVFLKDEPIAVIEDHFDVLSPHVQVPHLRDKETKIQW